MFKMCLNESMNKYQTFVIVGLLCGATFVQALPPVRGAFKVPRIPAVSGVRALIRRPQHITQVPSAAIMRKTFEASRRNFTGPKSVITRTRHSVAQISLPNHSAALGTGFVLKERGRLWLAMPYHIGGAAGRSRTVRLLGKDGSILEKNVKITLNGTAGWHAPDVSLVELPKEWYGKVDPLEIAPVDASKPVYSVGYVALEMGLDEVIPAVSEITHVDRENFLRKFNIPGATVETPISGSGHCGTPILQQVNGRWKVVGMHNGHAMDLIDPQRSVGSAVNLAGTIPQLVDNYFKPMAMNHGLTFRGWEIDRLNGQERVESIVVMHKDVTKDPIVRYIRNFEGPYSDANVEQALGDVDLKAGDTLIFNIAGRTETSARVNREVEFVIP